MYGYPERDEKAGRALAVGTGAVEDLGEIGQEYEKAVKEQKEWRER